MSGIFVLFIEVWIEINANKLVFNVALVKTKPNQNNNNKKHIVPKL